MKTFVGSVKQALELLNQSRIEHRLHCAALESLHFQHPYKKFVVAAKIRYPEDGDNVTKPTLAYDEFHLYDFGVQVAKITMYTPNGEKRDSKQLQVRYNYDVHFKEPRNIKRTSNLNKIDSLMAMIQPATDNKILDQVPGARDLVNKACGFVESQRAFQKFFSDMYYGDKSALAQTFDDLLNKRDTMAIDKLRKDFYETRDLKDKAQVEALALSKQVVSVVKNPILGEYRVIRYSVVKDGENKIMHSQTYNAKEDLPDDVVGNLAVLEIGLSSDDRARVDGVGEAMRVPYAEVSTLIGKDFNDPREEGEGQGI